MISEEKLQEWQRLANEATKGPWICVHDDFDETRITTSDREDGGFVHIASVDTDYEGHFGKEQEANLALILAAREAVPALIAEVRRLQVYAQVGRKHDWGNGR